MILIFGGVYQGKLDYALDRFKLAEHDVFKCSENEVSQPDSLRIIYELDKWILALVRAQADVSSLVQLFASSNKGAIVICNDISCGIVPADPTLRAWREAVGRALALLSKESDEVIRLFCGIPMRIDRGDEIRGLS